MKRQILFLFLIFTVVFTAKSQNYTLEQIYSTPYLGDLVTNPKTSDIIINVNHQGARNLYLLSAPDYKAKKITNFDKDQGQELTGISISTDGTWAVFVRGGDHGANTPPRPLNPTSSVQNGHIAVYSVNLKTLTVKMLDDGDYPLIQPNGKQVVYIGSKGQVKTVMIDGSDKPRNLFYDKGLSRALEWSPDGKKLLFASRRVDYSFIGVYELGAEAIKWIAPSFHKDDFPTWSPDGKKIAFVRREAEAMGRDSLRVLSDSKWQAIIYNLENDKEEEVYRSSNKLRVSYPRSLNWINASDIIYSSYEDGWPHLYSINPISKKSKLLTKGDYEVSDVSYSPDGNSVAFCANYAPNKEDVDRRQLGLIDLKSGVVKFLTKDDNICSSTAFIDNGKSVAFLNSTSIRPILPAVISTTGRPAAKLLSTTLLSGFNYNDLVVPEHIRYNAADGKEVYGQLFKPKNLKGKVPAIVYIHGGPRRQMLLGWNHRDYYFYDYALNQYLASRGYVVLSINYRSGTGYGYAFQNAPRITRSRNGHAEYDDILAGGKWLQEQSFVDSAKIGVYGGSHGGYLTAMALAKNSDIFKVGVDIHGVHMRLRDPEPISSLSKTQLAALYASPSFWVDGWKSPVLLIHGDDDQNVPFQHSVDLYNRLSKRNVEVEKIIIPDDTHHWMLFKNQLKVKSATYEFLDKHLKK